MDASKLPLYILFLFYTASSYAAEEGELFLTPLILAGEIEKARALAADNFKTAHIETSKETKSYSGYFTLNDSSKSNIFFWFFPAQQNPESAPVIQWINELPGYSTMRGVFAETGPFFIEDNKVKERNVTWTRTHSMLYVDAPAGTGFSFAEKEDVSSDEVEGMEYYECLQQFFTLFPEYRKLDLYLAGENYAGAFMPYVVKYVEDQNKKNEENKINIKGLIVSSGYLDSSQLTTRVSDLKYLGLLDEGGKKTMLDWVNKADKLHKEGKNSEAAGILMSTYSGPIIRELIGYNDSRSALRTDFAPIQLSFQKFLDTKESHKFLHTGLHKFSAINFEIFLHFGSEFYVSQVGAYEELLDKAYRILIIAPQFDLSNTMGSIRRVVDSFNWKGTAEYKESSTKIFRVDGDVAGYVKSAKNLAFAIVRNAGHYALMDQPEWMLGLVEKFLSGQEF